MTNSDQTGHDSPVPLREVLAAVTSSDTLDQAHIIAGAFNLYLESIRRFGSRKALAAEDIIKIFQMVETLIGAADLDQGLRQLVAKGRA